MWDVSGSGLANKANTTSGEVVTFELFASSFTRAYLQAPPDLQGQVCFH